MIFVINLGWSSRHRQTSYSPPYPIPNQQRGGDGGEEYPHRTPLRGVPLGPHNLCAHKSQALWAQDGTAEKVGPWWRGAHFAWVSSSACYTNPAAMFARRTASYFSWYTHRYNTSENYLIFFCNYRFYLILHWLSLYIWISYASYLLSKLE